MYNVQRLEIFISSTKKNEKKMFFNFPTFFYRLFYSATTLRFNSRIESPVDLRSTNSDFMHSDRSTVSRSTWKFISVFPLPIITDSHAILLYFNRPVLQIAWNKGGIVMRGATQTVIIYLIRVRHTLTLLWH